jgi:hypothetical protein
MTVGSAREDMVGGVLSLKVTLDGTRPAVWRRLLMSSEMTLGDLHHAIQTAMGWENAHLHAFRVADRAYSDPEYPLVEALDEEDVTLGRLVDSGISRFCYVYDFGDSWRHTIQIEKRSPKAEGRRLPACIAGDRACPPEDCGGSGAYEQLAGHSG